MDPIFSVSNHQEWSHREHLRTKRQVQGGEMLLFFFFRWCSMYGMPTCGSNSTYFVNRYTKHGAYGRGIWEMYIVFGWFPIELLLYGNNDYTRTIRMFLEMVRDGTGLVWVTNSALQERHRTWDLPMGDLVFRFGKHRGNAALFWSGACRYELCALGQEL